MKIRVTTDKYAYQGLYKGSEHEVDVFITKLGGVEEVDFRANGKKWTLTKEDFEVVDLNPAESSAVEKVKTGAYTAEKKTPIKSDGGSSTYYDIEIADWLLYTLNERQKEGKCYIKTEELIECGFSSDFDAGNIFKSLVRAFGALNGGGKAGNSVEYECNKIVYSANKLKQRNERKEKK